MTFEKFTKKPNSTDFWLAMAVFSCFLWQCFKSCYKQCNKSEEDETDARLDRATRRLEMVKVL